MSRIQELMSTFADYTVGSIIVVAYMTTAQWRGREQRLRGLHPSAARRAH